MIKYVAGFMFSPDAESVALVRKLKPDWQKDKLNGIGGKIEEGESCLECMCREFQEETGAETGPEDWEKFLTLGGSDWRVVFYRSFRHLDDLTTNEKELIEVHSLDTLDYRQTIPNLKWIIPMALDLQIADASVEEAW